MSLKIFKKNEVPNLEIDDSFSVDTLNSRINRIEKNLEEVNKKFVDMEKLLTGTFQSFENIMNYYSNGQKKGGLNTLKNEMKKKENNEVKEQKNNDVKQQENNDVKQQENNDVKQEENNEVKEQENNDVKQQEDNDSQ